MAGVLAAGRQVGDAVVFDFGSGTEVTIERARLSQFDASDVIL